MASFSASDVIAAPGKEPASDGDGEFFQMRLASGAMFGEARRQLTRFHSMDWQIRPARAHPFVTSLSP